MYNENEPIPYQAQHNYHSELTTKIELDDNHPLAHTAGILAVATLLLTIVGIVVSFR